MRALLTAIAAILTFQTAFAAEDLPRFSVAYYVGAFAIKDDTGMKTVVQYLAGIRDHLYWQCEYDITVKELMDAANFHILAYKETHDAETFGDWSDNTPFGDVVFLGINNTLVTGKPEPCHK
ncbi:hypothetical protein [Rhizobium mongolense]|uniref:Uncharacterized protein n=2 Tax=Rhizobium mongolense TaxID=57676 RepID=A0ABR6IRC1_9HYPH|nr:hypothetical protein [Rhizobium mongolense]MBB4230059.1 hypothetical protein [Rhizobium mongolense]TVZ72810.1 hypothetical protein BCL32_0997 [Rhizobium mongolense USDA 1844]